MEKRKIINQIKIKIAEQEVLRYLGYPQKLIHGISADIKKIVREEIEQAYSLLESRGIYQFLDISSVSANGIIMIKQGYRFTVNKKIIDLLKNAEYLLLMVVTIGLETEKAVKEKFQHGNHIRAMVLDAAGTVAVKTAGQWLNHFIEENNSREGLKFSRYFEPGSGDWDIREQKQIFEILKPERIGITLNPSFMMNPAKSLSWIRGSGHNLINSYRDEFSCQYCLLTNCPFRKN
jgi:cobalamin-dependent methionine synthase I